MTRRTGREGERTGDERNAAGAAEKAAAQERRYRVTRLDELPPTPCPCGVSRRAFVEEPERKASLHLVEIHEDAAVHHHRELTEVYYILEGEGHMELDGDRVPLRPGTAVLIKPGCRHRAVGRLKLLNLVVPAFDPEDEWLEEE